MASSLWADSRQDGERVHGDSFPSAEEFGTEEFGHGGIRPRRYTATAVYGQDRIRPRQDTAITPEDSDHRKQGDQSGT